MNTNVAGVSEKWFRSEKKLLEFLKSIGLEGKHNRIYKNGEQVQGKWFMYGMYSKQSWFVHYPS